MRHFPGSLSESDFVSLGIVEVCYQRPSSTLMFQDLEDEALISELLSRLLPDNVDALHVVIILSVAVPLAFLSLRTKLLLPRQLI